MKDKIIELIENKKGRYKAEELADEILKEVQFRCPSCECNGCNGIDDSSWYEDYKARKSEKETD